MVQVPALEDRLRAAEEERARLYRLEPSQPLKDADDAAAFVRERRMVTETGHAGVPVLAHTIAGRELVGSWMASPEVYRIYDLLNELAEHDFCSAPLLDGKVTIFDPSAEWTIDVGKFQSKSRNSPFGGMAVRGRADIVIVSGEVKFERPGR